MAEIGAMTEAPSRLTYSYVVSRNSVCFPLLIAGLNNLYIMAFGVGNTYLNVTC